MINVILIVEVPALEIGYPMHDTPTHYELKEVGENVNEDVCKKVTKDVSEFINEHVNDNVSKYVNEYLNKDESVSTDEEHVR